MSDKKNKSLIPKLRFPEFQDNGEWVNQKLFNVLKKISIPVQVDPDKLYQEIGIRSHGKGIFHKEPVYGKELGNKRVFWVEENTFIVNIVFAWELAVACTTETETGMIASHRFPMYKGYENKAIVSYIKYFFLTKKGKELLWIASPGGAGRNKTLGQKEFENLGILIPADVEEQQQITDCLTSLDELINAEAQKLDVYKAHKKGLMQILFPAEGKKVPKLRFPEFRDSGEWLEKELSELLEYERPEKYIVNDTDYKKNGIPVLTANKSFLLGYTDENYGIYQDTPVIIFDDFTVDNKYVDFHFKVKSSAIKILKAKQDNVIKFIYELIGTIQFDPKEHKRYYISVYQNILVRVPKPKEQQRIADCLSSLDDLITAQSKKIEALKVHKKGLMQGLFPSLEEVEE